MDSQIVKNMKLINFVVHTDDPEIQIIEILKSIIDGGDYEQVRDLM